MLKRELWVKLRGGDLSIMVVAPTGFFNGTLGNVEEVWAPPTDGTITGACQAIGHGLLCKILFCKL